MCYLTELVKDKQNAMNISLSIAFLSLDGVDNKNMIHENSGLIE